MRKIIICKISIEFEVEGRYIASSTDLIPWFKDFISSVNRIADSLGYVVPEVKPATSKLNGGVSTYYDFLLQREDLTIKVVVGFRFSNHKSKITVEEHKSIIRKDLNLSKDDPVKYIDVVQPDADYVHITIDGNTIRDEEAALQVVKRKLESIKDRSM